MRSRSMVLVLVLAHGACGEPDATGTSSDPLAGTNALTENSLSTNGVFQNGVFQNGVFQNGVFQNGVFQNGVFQNGLWQDAIWQRNPTAIEILRTNAYAPQVLQYIYGCAMADDQSAVLDPGGANVVLRGDIGLAPEWGAPDGTCDESCQRWVSACVLARTNAYGVKVEISMRAPADAPAHIREALQVEASELAAFPLREGAFYGNLFQQTPQPDGTVLQTPVFHACAGPGSNIPDITKRFCSSQGDDGPINVVGTCEPRPEFPRSACLPMLGDSSTGAMHECFTSTDPLDRGTRFKEVITVYIKQPLAVCGNSVCEASEHDTCPSDCHPGGWAHSFPGMFTHDLVNPGFDGDHTTAGQFWATLSAIGPDDTVVLAGVTRATVDLGTGPLPATAVGSGFMAGLVAKYDASGALVWAKRLGPFIRYSAGGVAIAPDGSIFVAGAATEPGIADDTHIVLTKLSPDGELLWTARAGGDASSRPIQPVLDRDGNILIGGELSAGFNDVDPVATFGSITIPVGQSALPFVAKLSPAGTPIWARSVGDPAGGAVTALAADRDGNALVGLFSRSAPQGLAKLAAATGELVWQRRGQHWAVTTDAAGDVYASGSLADPAGSQDTLLVDNTTYDFELPPTAGRGDFFIVKYAGGDGTVLALHTTPMSCRSTTPQATCQGRFDGRSIVIDGAGNIVVGIVGGNRAPIDLGAGFVHTYATWDVFVAAFSPSLTRRWVKHMPMILDGVHRGVAVDSRGHVVMSGTYAGSTLIDDRLLVNNIPEQRGNGNTFLASFRPPPLTDVAGPVLGHVPENIVVQATGPGGADVFFMPPTAIDGGHAGATVACVPAPNTRFPIGTTPVTCTASDPLNNQTSASFTVSVIDTLGPELVGVNPIVVEATGPSGAVAVFAVPTAIDLVDGPRAVTCDHASGASYPLGTTRVSCSAIDASGNQTASAFGVTVTDTTAPAIEVPATIAATATMASGAIVTYGGASANDLVDGALAPACSPASGSVFPLGTTMVTCTATDAHGNTGAGTFAVHVSFDWSGVLQPINADGSSSFKLGSTVGVKFRLFGTSGPIANATATLSLVKLSVTPLGTVVEAESTAASDSGSTFRYDAAADQYIFNLSTKGLTTGAWQLRIDLGDGLVRTVTISLRS